MTDRQIDIIVRRYASPPATSLGEPPKALVRDYLAKAFDLRELKGQTILEIGAGCSHYGRIFLDNGCERYIANDLIPERLAPSRIDDPRYQELPGDFLKIDLPKPVDIVFANLTMMFLVPLFPAFIAKIAKALRPGGLFIGMETNYWCPLSVLRRFADLKPNPARLFSPHRYAELYIRNGFVIERLVPFTARYGWTTGNWLLGTNFWLRAKKR